MRYRSYIDGKVRVSSFLCGIVRFRLYIGGIISVRLVKIRESPMFERDIPESNNK